MSEKKIDQKYKKNIPPDPFLIRIQEGKWMRIRIHSPAPKKILDCVNLI